MKPIRTLILWVLCGSIPLLFASIISFASQDGCTVALFIGKTPYGLFASRGFLILDPMPAMAPLRRATFMEFGEACDYTVGVYGTGFSRPMYTVRLMFLPFPFIAVALFGGLRAFRRWKRIRLECCQGCGYLLKGLPTRRCPECNTPF